MPDLAVVDEWTERLTGFSPEAVAEARREVDALGIGHLSTELTQRADVDAAATCYLLSKALGDLRERGVPANQLSAKLRRDPAVWPAVTELMAVASLARYEDSEVNLTLNAPAESGRNADMRFALPDTDYGRSIEFKALGLSDDEAAFFREVAELLPQMCPKYGVGTHHVALDAGYPITALVPSRADRRRLELENRRRSKRLPEHIRSLTGIEVVGHFGEERYLQRVRDRLVDAIGQTPSADEGWVALWWTNGAPAALVQRVLSTVDIPPHVLGVLLVGWAVVVPDPEVHHYRMAIPREEIGGSLEEDPPRVLSLEDHPLAEKILEMVESSSGLRAVLVQTPEGPRNRRVPVLFRNGARRIFPFNFLFAPDPSGIRELTAYDDRGESAEDVVRNLKAMGLEGRVVGDVYDG